MSTTRNPNTATNSPISGLAQHQVEAGVEQVKGCGKGMSCQNDGGLMEVMIDLYPRVSIRNLLVEHLLRRKLGLLLDLVLEDGSRGILMVCPSSWYC